MKKLWFLLLVISVCTAIGCGGGGGDSGPAPYTPEVEEVKPAYAAMQAAMKDNASDPTVRTNTVMSYVANEFVDNAGTPSYNELKSTTKSRLERYTVEEYLPIIGGSVKVEEGLISVTTSIVLRVTLKPGAVGTGGTTSVTMTSDVYWKKTDGVWKIVKGLPYKR